jgi:hypothetical protein
MLFPAWRVGHSGGVREGLKDSFYAHKLHADRNISALRNLSDGKIEDARSNLETGVNLSVALLTGQDRVELMDKKTKADIDATLREIKAYRKLNPWQGYNENLRLSITKALEAIPDAPSPENP